MFKKNYRLRLTVIFFIITLVPILFMGISGTYVLNAYVMDQYNQHMMQQINYETTIADRWFEDRIKLLRSIAHSVQLIENQPIDLEQMNQYLVKQNENASNFLNLYFTLEDGISPSALESKSNIDFRQRSWYVGAKKEKRLMISQPYEDLITGERVITISLPMVDTAGRFIGVIGGDLDFEAVSGVIDTSRLSDVSSHIIVNHEGQALWSNLEDAETETILENIDSGKPTEEMSHTVTMGQSNKKMIATIGTMSSTGWKIIFLSKMEHFYVYGNKIKLYFVGISVAAIIIMFLAIFATYKQMAKPMREIRDAVHHVSAGNFDIHIDREYQDEIGEVIHAFNQMAATIRGNYTDLTEQAQQLMEGNSLLQDMNIELEASYEQLQATTEQLNYSEQKYRLLMENLSELVWVIDHQGILTYINDEIESVLGYKKEEVLGKPLWTIMCPLHQYEDCENIIERFKMEDFDKLDLWMTFSDGETHVVMETNTRRIYLDGVFVSIQGIGRDVTETRKMQKEIVRKNKELTVINEISSSLTGTISTVRTDRLLEAIVNKIVEMMDVCICTIRLLNEEGELEFRCTAGNLSHLVSREPLHIDDDLIGKAVKEKVTVSIDHLDQRHVTRYNQQVIRTQRLKHMMFIPLKLGEEVIGVMAIGSENKLEEGQLNILNALSNHAAVTIEKSRLYEALKQAYFKTIKALAMAVEAKDTYTQGHSLRVAQYATLIGNFMGLTHQDIEALEVAGILHDIGKIGISETILTKPGKLSDEEFQNITQHPMIGSRILDPIGLSEDIMQAILLHHKRYDLKGYPNSIEVDHLPLFARIVGVADAFDAMLSKRSYKEPMSIEEALAELRRCSGSHFSPEVVEVMDEIYQNDVYSLKEVAGL